MVLTAALKIYNFFSAFASLALIAYFYSGVALMSAFLSAITLF
jgi:hypothetical protein